MLSDLQTVNVTNFSAQQKSGTSVGASLKSGAVGDESPKVQAPKPVEIKVDTEKLKAELQKSLDQINQAMRDGGRKLNFQMDEKLGGPIVLVKNADTGEVVRQIPNEVVVRIAHNIEEFKGMLHNELS